ncbi:6887_t:CDS:1, partial [Funneliformis geosporum]
FQVSISDKNNHKEKLKKALDNGSITYDAEHIQNIFSTKKESQPNVIESWQKLYPELCGDIEGWKYAFVDNDNRPTYDKRQIFPIQRGKVMVCIYLGIFTTSKPDVLKFVHFRAKITAKVRHYELLGNFSNMERFLLFLFSDGATEIANVFSIIYNAHEESKYTKMIDQSAEILAALYLSEKYKQIRIRWK